MFIIASLGLMIFPRTLSLIPKTEAPVNLAYRWVYVMTNLQVAKNADNLCELLTRSKKAGYTGVVVADSKMQRLGEVPDWYFANAKKVVEFAKSSKLDLIPCVWPLGYASSMLSTDVNLIEGLPVQNAEFVVKGQEARPVGEDSNLLPNGGLEVATQKGFGGLSFQDGPGSSTVPDADVPHAGNLCLRMQNFKQGNENGNARIVWTVKVQPFHQYIVSGWNKRESLKGYVQVTALDAKGRNLVVTEIDQKPNCPWTNFKYSFNSLENTEIKIYAGVWGGSEGKIWWDEMSLKDGGLLNVVRRGGCPLKVMTVAGVELSEGKDYEPVADPGLGAKPWAGEYDVEHPAPTIKIKPTGRIRTGDHLFVSFYHAKTGIVNQTSICLSEPKTLQVMRDEAKRIADLFKPRGLFWSHDEMRIGGWCQACESRKLTPGQMLAANARSCQQIQQSLLPGSETYVWSDMFDPSHNATDSYYLNNGSLKNSWEGLPKTAIVVNWNFGGRAKSLPFFAERGNKQILAGFYDAPVGDIKTWLRDTKAVKGVCGVMYTTWVGDYSKLEEFARASWGETTQL